jgi:sugar lactone lactonase YvrE
VSSADSPGPAPVPGGSRARLAASFGFAGLLLGLLPLWNGAAYISAAAIGVALWVLLPLRLYTLGLLAAAALVGLPQVLFWRDGADLGAQRFPAFHFGFLVEEATPGKVLAHMAYTVGFKWLPIAAALLLARRLGRAMMLAVFAALAVCLLVKFSIDPPTNHKFFNIWTALINVAAAYGIYRVGRMGVVGFVGAAVLTVSITLGGVIDVTPFFLDDTTNVRMEDDRLTEWVRTRTRPQDVFLTPTYMTHPILLAGRKLFFGHEFYAWAAGYPVDARGEVFKQLYSETDPNVLVRILNENHIRYVCFDREFSEGKVGRNEFVYRAYFMKVFEDGEGQHDGFRIYEVPFPDVWALGGGQPIRPLVPPPTTPAPPPPRLAGLLGLAVGVNGEVLVTEPSTRTVQRIARDGRLLGGLGLSVYREPTSVAVDPRNGEVLVADTWKHRVVRLSPEGAEIGELPAPPHGFYAPCGVTVAEDGQVFVANTGNTEIVRYDADRQVKGAWGTRGAGPGQFGEPLALTVSGQELYVADLPNGRVQVFTLEGRFLRQWAVPEWVGTTEYRGLDVHDGRVYVADAKGNAVLVFGLKGERLDRVESPLLVAPSGLAVSADGVLHVASLWEGSIAVLPLQSARRIRALVPRPL